MINRVLIRIKVVQMLYSYLLTKSEFRIETAPDSPGKDRRFAYMVYLDTLLFILELSGYRVQGPDSNSPAKYIGENKHLAANKMMASLINEEQIRSLILKRNTRIASFDKALSPVLEAITATSAYRSYIRLKERTLADDITFWTTMLRTVIAKNPVFMECARENGEFTISGYDRGILMVEDTLRSYSDNRGMLTEARNSLQRSLDKAYELYHLLLLLPVEITRMRDQQIDAARHKYLPTDEDLNPNTRFIDNHLPALIASSPSMEEYLKANPVSWADDFDLVKRLLDQIMASEVYAAYMSAPATDRATDCDFWRTVFRTIILPSDDLAEVLESKSLYWNDDIDIMGTFVLKTIKRIGTSDKADVSLLPQYKDDEDARFGADLFLDTVNHFDDYRAYIDKFINSSQWDPERLAFMDIVIMTTAIAEMLNYPQIPIPVTLNEYIEIANSYSTPRSGAFVNGILYSVINYLKEQGKLTKE